MRLTMAVAVSLALVFTGAALAAKPKKGKSYSGTLAAPRTAVTVSFKVSKSGKKVTALKINNLPLYCSGGGPPVPITFKNAKISKSGRFKSKGHQTISTGPNQGQVGARLKISGRFKSGGAEAGTLKTTYPASASCSGSSTYTTHAG
jgi:hypothetical protein